MKNIQSVQNEHPELLRILTPTCKGYSHVFKNDNDLEAVRLILKHAFGHPKHNVFSQAWIRPEGRYLIRQLSSHDGRMQFRFYPNRKGLCPTPLMLATFTIEHPYFAIFKMIMK